MKKVLISLFVFLYLTSLYGQSFEDLVGSIGPDTGMLEPVSDGWNMGGMLGLLVEEDPTTGETAVYARLGFQPDFSLGKFGIGFNITLDYNIETKELKEADYNENDDYLKLIRYIRYGKYPFEEGIYLKAGALDNATLGHGFIINRYKTDVDYDNRRVGLQCNFNYEYWGLETFTNNLFLNEVVGARISVRPMGENPLPILNDIGFGLTIAVDSTAPYSLQDDETYDVVAATWSAGSDGLPDWDRDGLFIIDSGEALSLYGLDAEVPLLRSGILALTFYIDYAQIRNVGPDTGPFSDGMGIGFFFDFKLTSGNRLYVKAEQRYIDRNFIPAYFNKMYEIERLQLSTESPLLTKLGYLELLPDKGRYKGIYSEVAFEVLNIFEVWGTFEDNQDVPDDGAVQVGMGLKALAGIKAAVSYTKSNIDDSNVNDIFILDDRSLFLAYLSYKISNFIEIGTVFQRNWELDMSTGEYKPVDSYHAGISFYTEF